MVASAMVATVLVLGGVRWMRAWLFERAPMPESVYRRGFLAPLWVREWRLVFLALAPGLAGLAGFGLGGWDALGVYAPVRWVIATGAIALAWTYSAYERNAFLDRTHGLDRLLTLGLSAMVVVHPAACALLAVHVGVM